MAWIRIMEAEDGDETLRDAYEAVAGRRGHLANILKIHSLNPAVMISHLRLYADVMFGPSELTRTERELLALAVSSINGCHY
jgi:alkylhydroperoxidase family enzyme